MKDNFSTESDKYAKFRPTYPSDLFDYLDTVVTNNENAWDCGTGNGQVAYELAKRFDHVYATDISLQQLENARRADNIEYSVQSAENTNFENGKFDLIIVAQAIHWFDFEKFYNEVRRTAKEDAKLCVLGYGLLKISPVIDNVISDFYENIIGKFWDEERKYLDEDYQTIPFPFDEINTPKFENLHRWNLAHLIGYLNTWSAVKHYIKHYNHNPVEELELELKKYWDSEEIKEVRFPILLRIGHIKDSRKNV